MWYMIQSSGTGKSQMVYEMAKLVFAIPRNLLPTKHCVSPGLIGPLIVLTSTGYVDPPPDLVVRLFDTIEPKHLPKGYCIWYFWYLALPFAAVLEELELIGKSKFPTSVVFTSSPRRPGSTG